MYDELVKRLREVADEVDSDYDVDPYNAEQRCLAILQAADAIEELSRDLDSMNEANIALYGALPNWIPVTERLPEEYKDVLCYYEYFRYGDYNCMFRTIDRGYYGNGIWGGEAGQGHKNKVIAWMPLPEPPKEG